MRWGIFLVAALAAGLAACAPGDVVLKSPPAGYVADAPAKIEAADWSHPETVNVTLSSYAFTPQKLVLKTGVAYRLHLVNDSGSTHTFTSEGFFMAIAAKELRSAEGAVESPYVKNIALAPKTEKDLLFVAVKPGSYAFHCAEPFHAALGMTGEITIRPRA